MKIGKTNMNIERTPAAFTYHRTGQDPRITNDLTLDSSYAHYALTGQLPTGDLTCDPAVYTCSTDMCTVAGPSGDQARCRGIHWHQTFSNLRPIIIENRAASFASKFSK